ncbi:MAG: hypothetical protein LJE70_11180 [Chromatiaceae bacterium]|nr:hypothetical protein [Chromatiaceae bacterium]
MPRMCRISYHGRDWCLSDLAREHHLHPNTLAARLKSGMSIEQALSTKISTKSEAGSRGFAASLVANRRTNRRSRA